MKLICAFCGFRNKSTAANCAKCGGSLADARREKLHLPWASWIPILPIIILCNVHSANERQKISDMEIAHREALDDLIDAQTAALKKFDENFAGAESEEDAKHQSLMRDEKIISGSQAAGRHALEWSRRQKHDPAFVSTILERTLTEVERLGKDPALTAETALKKVTELVCPPGSRIEVTPSGVRFTIRVAFRLSAVAPNEVGTMTYHTTPAAMRTQIEDSTARLVQALFDYCGGRGIERISVSCNRAITQGEPGAERLKMRSLYRATVDAAKASQVANWRALSLAQIKSLVKVEHNVLSTITIEHGGAPGLALDPNEPLEF